MTDEVYRFAPADDADEAYVHRFTLNTFGMKAMLDLIPQEVEAHKRLIDAMGYGSKKRTENHEAVKVLVLECILQPKDCERLDEVFEVYRQAKPGALLNAFSGDLYPKHLVDLFSLIFGWGRLCVFCFNVEQKSATPHRCLTKVQKKDGCLVNDTCSYDVGTSKDHKKNNHSLLALHFAEDKALPKKAQVNKFMTTPVTSANFYKDSLCQIDRYYSRKSADDTILNLDNPSEILLINLLPIFLGLEHHGVVGDPYKLYQNIVECTSVESKKEELKAELKKLDEAKKIKESDLVKIKELIG